jgi:hypothetical protein
MLVDRDRLVSWHEEGRDAAVAGVFSVFRRPCTTRRSRRRDEALRAVDDVFVALRTAVVRKDPASGAVNDASVGSSMSDST